MGFGENYVLGTKDEENEYKPFKLDHENMVKGKRVLQVCPGT